MIAVTTSSDGPEPLPALGLYAVVFWLKMFEGDESGFNGTPLRRYEYEHNLDGTVRTALIPVEAICAPAFVIPIPSQQGWEIERVSAQISRLDNTTLIGLEHRFFCRPSDLPPAHFLRLTSCLILDADNPQVQKEFLGDEFWAIVSQDNHAQGDPESDSDEDIGQRHEASADRTRNGAAMERNQPAGQPAPFPEPEAEAQADGGLYLTWTALEACAARSGFTIAAIFPCDNIEVGMRIAFKWNEGWCVGKVISPTSNAEKRRGFFWNVSYEDGVFPQRLAMEDYLGLQGATTGSWVLLTQ